MILFIICDIFVYNTHFNEYSMSYFSELNLSDELYRQL